MKNLWPVSLCQSFLALLLIFSLSILHAQSFSGKAVVSVQYDPSTQPLDSRDLANMQLVRAGQPLNRDQVATTIDRMFASGLYDDIQVDAEPGAGGVTIRFITRARQFHRACRRAGQYKIASEPRRDYQRCAIAVRRAV